MKSVSRGGALLAAALIAGGLTSVAAPPAQADSDLLVLNDAQVTSLSQRLQVDPYGDAGATVDPQRAARGIDAEATKGSGFAAAADGVSLTKDAALEGARGMAQTVPLAGSGGGYLTLHGLGVIQRMRADGSVVWRRDNASLYSDWQVEPLRPWQAEPYPAKILMGFNAVSPFTAASDNGYATGDLTGDGVGDLVFTADVGTFPYRPFASPDSTLPTGSFVTVLDGRTGTTLWSKLYAAAYNVTLVGRTLVIADSPNLNVNAPAGAKPTLTGIQFKYAHGSLTPSKTWTHEVDATDGAAWASLLALPGNKVAASWDQRKLSADDVSSGHTMVLDARNGAVGWERSNVLYSRQLHLDADRGRLVALEQADPGDGVRYQVALYSLTTGARSTSGDRENAFPIDLAIGDIVGNRKAEYVVSEVTLDPNLFVNASTVRALSGLRTQLWSRTVKRDPANSVDGAVAFGLRVVDGDVTASYLDDKGNETAENRSATRAARLAVLNGGNGHVRWERRGVVASQMWVQPVRSGRTWALRTVDADENLRTYALDTGRQAGVLPLPAAVSSGVLAAVDKGADQDVIVGGQSSGVWAYDGAALMSGRAKVLWRAVVPGQVHAIVKADTTGDGRDELVVAADTATVVLDVRTGKRLATISGGGQFVWTVTTADLDGDGAAEIVVPTDRVRVYRGTGRLLWSYAAPESAGDVVFAQVSVGDGRVYAEYGTRTAFGTRTGAVAGVALNGRTGAVRWSADPHPEGATGEVFAVPMRAATYASPDIPYADGHAVVMMWNAPAANSPQQVWTEIRDGRTGEVLHTAATGGSWTPGNWYTDGFGLHLAGVASIRTFGPDGVDTTYRPSGQTTNAQPLTGPGGRALLVAGGAAGFNVVDAAGVAAGSTPDLASIGILGGRELLTGDIDGDGTDEIVSLNFDETGTDRMAGLEDGGYYVPYTAIQQLTVLSLSGS